MKKILMTILCAMFFTFGMVFSANAMLVNGSVEIDAGDYPTDKGTDTLVEPYLYYIGSYSSPLAWWYGYQEGVGTAGSTLYSQHSAPAVADITGDALEWYKSDYSVDGLGSDSGPAASWYETSFSNSAQDAVISWNSGEDYIDGATHLLVKDGAADPVWYLFDIFGWDGTSDIVLSNFWPDNGAISHIALYGGTPVPEPGMVILLGIGLIGLAFFSRKRLLN